MRSQNDEPPKLNYLWVGPPRPYDSGNNIMGSDIADVVAMARKAQNPVCYYCLDEHKDHYNKLFSDQGVNIKVVSIDNYLVEMQKNHPDDQMKKYAAKMIEVKNELLNPPRNRIVDRVTFKDAFSLFLLASEGGYTLDTSVQLANKSKEIQFPNYPHFKAPHTERDVDCWMMYASPDKLEEPRVILENYLAKWDSVQDIIRNKTKNIEAITKFHDNITGLMIKSIGIGLDQIQDGYRLNHGWSIQPASNDISIPVDAAGIDALSDLPVTKVYRNSHKSELECKQIVIDQVKEFANKNSQANYDGRDKLLRALENSLEVYNKYDKVDYASIYAINITINNLLESIKELDRYAQRLASVTTDYKSKSHDPVKVKFSQDIQNEIDSACKSLQTNLDKVKDKNPVGARAGTNIVKKLQTNVNGILTEAKNHHKKKHGIMSNMHKSRFNFDDMIESATRPKR